MQKGSSYRRADKTGKLVGFRPSPTMRAAISEAVLFRNYRERVTEEDAKQFWLVAP